jgi:hypothetical protein
MSPPHSTPATSFPTLLSKAQRVTEQNRQKVLVLVLLVALALISVAHGGFQINRLKADPVIKDSNSVTRGVDNDDLAISSNMLIRCLDNANGTSASAIATSTLPDGWCLDENKTPRYIARRGQSYRANSTMPNETHRYTHKGFDQCLANKTVVFIGDSRVRYQFLNLIDFLKTHRWMRCDDRIVYDNNDSQPADPNCFLIQNPNANTWNAWYNKSTALTITSNTSNDGHTIHGREQQNHLCDCFRPVPLWMPTTYENRFVKRRTPFGEANLIMLINYQNKIKMGADFPPFSSFDDDDSKKRCSPGSCGGENRTNSFIGNVIETLWNIVPQLHATHVFASLGWTGLESKAQNGFSCALQEFGRKHPGIKVFLITHPLNRGAKKVWNVKANLKCNVSVMDRTTISTHVPSKWYWDNLHVLSILNEEYNHQLIEMICPLQDHNV